MHRDAVRGRPAASSRSRSPTIDARAGLRHLVDVVEHHQHDVAGATPAAGGSGRGSRRRRTSAGRAPTPACRPACTSRSTSTWWATSVESWSGRSSSTSPSRSRSSRGLVEHAVAHDLVALRARRASRAARPAPSAPQAHAIVHDVVGRRTPMAASSRPVSALNVEDLPDPVAPASATTVWSPDSASRAPARSATAAASSTRASSSRPRAARGRLVAGRRSGRPTSDAAARPAAWRPPPARSRGSRLRARRRRPVSANRRSSTRRDTAAQPVDVALVDAERVEHLEVAGPLGVHQRGRPARRGPSRGVVGEPAYGLVAEDRLEQLLAERPRCRRRCRPRRR